jgi:hypothetical protein
VTRSNPFLLMALLTACGASTPDRPADKAAPAKAEPAPPADAPGKTEPFATPKAKPPPPPDGAALIEPGLYVQRCDAAHACPELLQPAGETHCRELRLGGLANWRLPDRAEVQRFATGVAMEKLEGFHWTRSAYAEDGKQAWIVDPKTGQETTIPRDRKPFTIRCVFEP